MGGGKKMRQKYDDNMLTWISVALRAGPPPPLRIPHLGWGFRIRIRS
jgi:hypothetical protein